MMTSTRIGALWNRQFSTPLVRCATAALLSLTMGAACDAATINIVGMSGTITVTIGVTSPVTVSPTTNSLSFSSAQITAGQHVRFSVKADASTFSTAPYPCSLVTWTADNAVNGATSPGTLDSSSFGVVYVGAAGATSGSFDMHWSMARPAAPTFSAPSLSYHWLVDFF